MSYKSAVQAITSHFASGWGTPIAYDNVNFTKPNEQWVRLSIQPNLGEAVDIGANLERQSGLIFVQCFTPDNEGPYTPATLAQDVADKLRFKRLSRTGERDVRTYAATINRVGNSDGYHQINVSVAFEYDDET